MQRKSYEYEELFPICDQIATIADLLDLQQGSDWKEVNDEALRGAALILRNLKGQIIECVHKLEGSFCELEKQLVAEKSA